MNLLSPSALPGPGDFYPPSFFDDGADDLIDARMRDATGTDLALSLCAALTGDLPGVASDFAERLATARRRQDADAVLMLLDEVAEADARLWVDDFEADQAEIAEMERAEARRD